MTRRNEGKERRKRRREKLMYNFLFVTLKYKLAYELVILALFFNLFEEGCLFGIESL